VRRACQIAFVLSATIPAAGQKPDARALIRQSIQNYDKSWRSAMQWSYTQTDVTWVEGKQEVDVSSVIPLEGTPYERLLTKDGRALTPEEKRKEDEKYDRELRRRQTEPRSERTARIRKYEKERSFLADLPNAYNFRLLGDELVGARPAWLVELSPRPGFAPMTQHGGLLKHIAGKLWIDKKDLQWAKAEADVIDTVSIGVILARIGPGAHINLNFERISDALWLPKEINIKGAARVLLVHTKDLDEHLTFADYHYRGGQSVEEVASSTSEPRNR
jgi:hypothetical protein